jgi:hypothetical protein
MASKTPLIDRIQRAAERRGEQPPKPDNRPAWLRRGAQRDMTNAILVR